MTILVEVHFSKAPKLFNRVENLQEFHNPF